MSGSRTAVFLDRDGVINRRPSEGKYITTVEEFELLPGVGAAIERLTDNGFLVIVATNQRCIALDIASQERVQQIHDEMRGRLAAQGARIDRVFVCPHDVADRCGCRKPKPGTLQRAAADYSLDLAACWMVGDTESDIVAGRSAGCRTVRATSEPAGGADFFCW